jgi:transposase InsO family protein
MGQFIRKRLVGKWDVILKEYDLIKHNQSPNFTHVRQLCNAYSVTRRDVQKYHARWIESGKSFESLLPRKRGPKPGSLKLLSKQDERLIMGIRRRLRANEFEIYHLIQGRFKKDPSVSTIYRTFKRYPLHDKKKALVRRYEKLYPGEQAHADTHLLDRTLFLDRKRRYLFGLLDDHTRLCYVRILEDNKAPTVTRAFFEGYKWFWTHGIRIEEVLTDNGSEFTCYTSWHSRHIHFFETMLKIIGIKHKYTRPYRPQTNGKIERFWRILDEECIRLLDKAVDPKELQAEIDGYLERYNYRRRHSGLKHTTPLDRLRTVTGTVK